MAAHILNTDAGLLAIHFHQHHPSIQAVTAMAVQSEQPLTQTRTCYGHRRAPPLCMTESRVSMYTTRKALTAQAPSFKQHTAKHLVKEKRAQMAQEMHTPRHGGMSIPPHSRPLLGCLRGNGGRGNEVLHKPLKCTPRMVRSSLWTSQY